MTRLIKHWRLIVVLIGVLSVVGVVLYFGHTKYREGYNKATQACEMEKQRAIDEALSINKKQRAVIRPDDRVLIERLRGGWF